MIYALNIYDIIPGKESIYSEYGEKVASLIGHLDMSFVASGHQPIREIAGKTRDHFVLAQFKDLATFEALMQILDANDLHRLREESTENYIWTLYEAWNFGG